MKGIEFLYDQDGEPKVVMIDLKKHRQLWEDFQDLLAANERRHEPRESLEDVKARIQRKRKANSTR
jgi:hypothetical protein